MLLSVIETQHTESPRTWNGKLTCVSRVNSPVNFLVISAMSIFTIHQQRIPVFYLWLACLPLWLWLSSSSSLGFESLICTMRFGATGVIPKHSTGTQTTASEWPWWKFHLLASTLTYWIKVQGQEKRGHRAACGVGLGMDSLTKASGGSWYGGLEIINHQGWR